MALSERAAERAALSEPDSPAIAGSGGGSRDSVRGAAGKLASARARPACSFVARSTCAGVRVRGGVVPPLARRGGVPARASRSCQVARSWATSPASAASIDRCGHATCASSSGIIATASSTL